MGFTGLQLASTNCSAPILNQYLNLSRSVVSKPGVFHYAAELYYPSAGEAVGLERLIISRICWLSAMILKKNTAAAFLLLITVFS
jgi:hypothetical protein